MITDQPDKMRETIPIILRNFSLIFAVDQDVVEAGKIAQEFGCRRLREPVDSGRGIMAAQCVEERDCVNHIADR